jgi:phage shock protein C
MSNEKRSTMLYRIPERGRIAGVCAGLGDRFGVEVWLIRIGAVSAFFLGVPFIPVLYIAAWLLLDKKPARVDRTSSGFDHTVSVKSKVWQQGQPPQRAFNELKTQYQQLERRLQQLESHVTSPEFNLSNEINKL